MRGNGLYALPGPTRERFTAVDLVTSRDLQATLTRTGAWTTATVRVFKKDAERVEPSGLGRGSNLDRCNYSRSVASGDVQQLTGNCRLDQPLLFLRGFEHAA